MSKFINFRIRCHFKIQVKRYTKCNFAYTKLKVYKNEDFKKKADLQTRQLSIQLRMGPEADTRWNKAHFELGSLASDWLTCI